MSALTQGNLLPFRQYNESEVVNLFALEGTGQNGLFVAMITGNQDPATTAGSYGTTNVGYAPANTTSLRHLVTRRVEACAADDDKYSVLGVTLHTVAEVDENGNKLINFPSDQTYERGYVVSGQTVPILKRGIITLKKSQVTNTPIPGYVGVPAAGGGIAAYDPANQVATATGAKVLGRFLSTTGDKLGGYVQFAVEL